MSKLNSNNDCTLKNKKIPVDNGNGNAGYGNNYVLVEKEESIKDQNNNQLVSSLVSPPIVLKQPFIVNLIDYTIQNKVVISELIIPKK
jgi:hypothetical protein